MSFKGYCVACGQYADLYVATNGYEYCFKDWADVQHRIDKARGFEY